MARRGAKHFLLLSRSGASSKDARELLSEMQKIGVTIVAPPCNVSDEHALATILSDLAEKLPPIKGCIQAAIVLEVSNIFSL